MTKVLVGLFDDFTAALNTTADLVSAGIPREDISVVANDAKGEFTKFQPAEEPTATVAGASTGAALGGFGGLLLGLGALAIPGIGPLVIAGPLAAALAGATLGAAAGGLIGAFNDLGVPEEKAPLYVEGVRRGGTVLTAKVPDELVGEASEILRRHRAVDIEERAAQWRQNGWVGAHTPAQSTLQASAEPTAQPSLDIDDGRVILKKKRAEVFSSTPTSSSLATYTEHTAVAAPVGTAVSPAAQGDTTVIKVNSRYSPKGKHGQKYLAAGVKLSMRLWEDEQPGKAKPATQRDYETVGYVIKGRAELQLQGQTVSLEPGDSWVVPKGSPHRFKILEPFTAVEATYPPAEVHGRDES